MVLDSNKEAKLIPASNWRYYFRTYGHCSIEGNGLDLNEMYKLFKARIMEEERENFVNMYEESR